MNGSRKNNHLASTWARLVSFAFMFLLAACAHLPDITHQRLPASRVNFDTVNAPDVSVANVGAVGADVERDAPPSLLGENIAKLVQNNRPFSGVYLLDNGADALNMRRILAQKATQTLDIQYYLWRLDRAGSLLLHDIEKAAERGVKVRLLLDDNNTLHMDTLWLKLASHKNIEVRLFNPFAHRTWRSLSYLGHFQQLNRRMHNKSFTVDKQVSIVGGRNIGNEYFDLEQGLLFSDLDVLAIGPVVHDIGAVFDAFWDSQVAYNIEDIAGSPHGSNAQNSLIFQILEILQVARNPPQDVWRNGQLPFIFAPVKLVSDTPDKVLPFHAQQASMLEALDYALREPKSSIWLVSPYFVPGKTGGALLSMLAKNGVAVHVLTNSLASSDVKIVHSGYQKYRAQLVKSGVDLYEFKPHTKWPRTPTKGHRNPGLAGSTRSLHAKTVVMDEKRVFVGSFNLDPRSAYLNTEMGLVIYSPQLARGMLQAFQMRLPAMAYHVQEKDGYLHWNDMTENKSATHDPETTWWQRVWVKILSYLPLEGLL